MSSKYWRGEFQRIINGGTSIPMSQWQELPLKVKTAVLNKQKNGLNVLVAKDEVWGWCLLTDADHGLDIIGPERRR